MKIAVLSDIHANKVALDYVLESVRTQTCDRIVCLGDIVGYGPQPNECVEQIRANADIVLAGNHDHAAIGLTNIESFNPYARRAIEWTREQLSAGSRDYLRQLPFEKRWQESLFVHASPCQPEMWNYVLSPMDARLEFGCFDEAVCFIGHSHTPLIFSFHPRRGIRQETGSRVALDSTHRYIINVGSVGQPRDGHPEASWVLYDEEQQSLERFRIAYPVEQVQKEMQQYHLPDFLIKRLSHGR